MALTCIECTHWLPKRTEPKLARLGFAQCAKKSTGHTMSAEAAACPKFAATDQAAAAGRRVWLDKQGGVVNG